MGARLEIVEILSRLLYEFRKELVMYEIKK